MKERENQSSKVHSFPIEIFDNHALIRDGENLFLIDTGSPTTFHRSGNLLFCSEEHSCSTVQQGLTVSQIAEFVGAPITTLLGADILSKYNVLFDYPNRTVQFSREKIPFEGVEFPTTAYMGVPIVELTVNQQPLKFFLDTGAKLSYLNQQHISGYKSVGVEDDFYPGLGKFQTECFEIPSTLNGKTFTVKYGLLPNILQMSLIVGGVDGIIGFDFFNNFKILLDIKNRSIKTAATTP